MHTRVVDNNNQVKELNDLLTQLLGGSLPAQKGHERSQATSSVNTTWLPKPKINQ